MEIGKVPEVVLKRSILNKLNSIDIITLWEKVLEVYQ